MLLSDLSNDSTLDEIIDTVLNELNADPSCEASPFEDTEKLTDYAIIHRVVRLMSYHSLALVKGIFGSFNYTLEITERGILIASGQGWLAYVGEQEKETQEQKQREAEAHQAIIASTRASKVSAISAIISLVIALSATYITWVGYNDTKKKDAEIGILNKEIIEIKNAKKIADSLLQEKLKIPSKTHIQKDSVRAPKMMLRMQK